MIEATDLRKTFYVHRKQPGLWGSVKSLLLREKVAKEAVRGVSFRVDEGEIVGLLGANGAGKTTVVKMLAGIIHPSGGDARVLGHVPWKRDDRMRRQIALIMGQKAQLWWDLPAADSFLLLKEIYRIPDARFRDTLHTLAEMLEVQNELHIQLRRLSLGERMKMELIAALLHQPRVVYLDEPTIGLDLSAQRAVREFLLEYRQEHQPAMLVTSHYMEDIERLCERILILREGELVYDGPLQQVIERFARHKIITARLDPGVLPEALRDSLETPCRIPRDDELQDLGRVLSCTDIEVRLEVPRADVTRAAAELLQRFPVVDLAIEEEDVGTIIEGLLRARQQQPEEGEA